MILNPAGKHGTWCNLLEASSSGEGWYWYEGDGHCLQQLQVHPACRLVA
jgi:hypothetical protein